MICDVGNEMMTPEIRPLHYLIFSSGLLGLIGWVTLAGLVVVALVLIARPPHPGRRISPPDIFAACLHVQIMVFIFCMPLALARAAYLTLDPIPDVIARDMIEAAMALLLNLGVGGALLGVVSIRHRTRPKIGWLPVLCVVILLLEVFTTWAFRMVLCTWRINWWN